MNRLRVSQQEITENAALLSGAGAGANAGVAAGSSEEVAALRAALAASRQREEALATKLKAKGGAGAADDSDDEPPASKAGAGASASAGTGGSSSTAELEAQLAARTAELAKEREDAARKQAALEDWTKKQIALEQAARDRERKDLQTRIAELEAMSEQDKDSREAMLKKLKKTLQASGSAEQVAAIKALHRKMVSLRSEFEALKTEAFAQRKVIAPDVAQFGAAIRSKIGEEAQRTEDAVKKYRVAVQEKKKLYNELQAMRGNIRVYCRTRPISAAELAAGDQLMVTPQGEDEVLVVDPARDNARKVFKFDKIYAPDSTQELVFQDTKPLITSVLDGYNCCIFAYGQTGSGKTYTMEGPDSEAGMGINRRALRELFRVAAERAEDYAISITVSNVELYNENLYDLLAETRGEIHSIESRLEVRQDANGRVFVPDLVTETAQSYEDVLTVMDRGKNNRATFATDMNEHSSRSHSILQIAVRCANKITHMATIGKLSLVDLAGSERLDRSNAVGERAKEAAFINKSLSALGDVIMSLTGDAKHVPYRNSKLTYLLADSLGGDSKTLMFVQVAPGSSNVAESLCSLNFASRVRSVKLQLASVHTENPETAQLKAELAAREARLAAMEAKLAAAGK